MLRIRICISFIPVAITELYIRLDNLAAIFEANSKPNDVQCQPLLSLSARYTTSVPKFRVFAEI